MRNFFTIPPSPVLVNFDHFLCLRGTNDLSHMQKLTGNEGIKQLRVFSHCLLMAKIVLIRPEL